MDGETAELFPHVESKRVLLRPVSSRDAADVYDVLFASGGSVLPKLDDFVRDFGRGVAAQFLVTRRDTGGTVGYCALSDLSEAGHVQASVHVTADPAEELHADVAVLAVNFAFAMWRIRKVYFSTHDADLSVFGFRGDHADLVRTEAVLPEHLYFDGQLHDGYVHAVYRSDWDDAGLHLLAETV